MFNGMVHKVQVQPGDYDRTYNSSVYGSTRCEYQNKRISDCELDINCQIMCSIGFTEILMHQKI